MATLLMCKPSYYGIEYEINPWMSRRRPADPERAARQWYDLYRALTEGAGATVELMEPVPGLPDLAFAANAGLVHGGTFVRSNFRFKERAREEPVWEAWFASQGFRVATLPQGQKFEGEGDAFIVGGTLFAGYRFRSHPAAHRTLGRLLDKRVVSLKLVDPFFYHLDTCFCPLGPDRVMYYPQAFSEASRRCIEKQFPQRIAVSAHEARRFVCNSIVIGDRVIANRGCPEAEEALATWGYRVLPVDTSEFLKAGGSAKCLALFLDPQLQAEAEDAARGNLASRLVGAHE